MLRPRVYRDRRRDHGAVGGQTGDIAKEVRGTHLGGATGTVVGGFRWYGLRIWSGNGLNGVPRGGPEGVRHQARKS